VQIGPVVVTLACCALRRGGMEVRLPEDVDRQPGVAFAPELKTLIEELVVEAAKADPEARKHLAQWRWRR